MRKKLNDEVRTRGPTSVVDVNANDAFLSERREPPRELGEARIWVSLFRFEVKHDAPERLVRIRSEEDIEEFPPVEMI